MDRPEIVDQRHKSEVRSTDYEQKPASLDFHGTELS